MAEIGDLLVLGELLQFGIKCQHTVFSISIDIPQSNDKGTCSIFLLYLLTQTGILSPIHLCTLQRSYPWPAWQ